MKDTVITGKVKKRELLFLIASVLVAFILNIYAIITHDTSWNELYTQIHVVILVAIVLYAISLLLRLIIFGIIKLVKLF